jgi:hypothetical protein
MCRRRGRMRSGAIIRIERLLARRERPLADRGQLDGREGRRGEFQSFRPRRDVEHHAAPVAVEAGEDGTQIVVWGCTAQLHRQAAERAVRVRSVGVHAPSHRLTWLIKGKTTRLSAIPTWIEYSRLCNRR